LQHYCSVCIQNLLWICMKEMSIMVSDFTHTVQYLHT
jgi:hypothetical protein